MTRELRLPAKVRSRGALSVFTSFEIEPITNAQVNASTSPMAYTLVDPKCRRGNAQIMMLIRSGQPPRTPMYVTQGPDFFLFCYVDYRVELSVVGLLLPLKPSRWAVFTQSTNWSVRHRLPVRLLLFPSFRDILS